MTAAFDDFQPVSRTHVSQGLNLHYLDWGNEGAPLLLLVHGMRDHAHSWDWTARALRRDWHVVAIDLRGHGDSQWSPDGAYLSAYNTLDLANLIDRLGDGPLTIVGHSYGGGVSARYAALNPDRMRKLVLIEGLGASPRVLREWAALGPVRRLQIWMERHQASVARPPRRMPTLEDAVARMAAANPHLSAEQATHLARYGVRPYPDGYGWKYDPLVDVIVPEEFSTDNTVIWQAILCPTLLFHGVQSWMRDPELDGRTSHFADHRLLKLEGAGHWLHHDQFEGFIAALRDFR